MVLFIALLSRVEAKRPCLPFSANADGLCSSKGAEMLDVSGAGIPISNPSSLELARRRPCGFTPAWLQNAVISWEGPRDLAICCLRGKVTVGYCNGFLSL